MVGFNFISLMLMRGGLDGRKEGCLGDIGVEGHGEQFWENMGYLFHRNSNQMSNVLLAGIKTGKEILNHMKGAVKDQYQFSGFVVINVNVA